MFTGIIEAVGSVKRLQPLGGDLRFEIDAGKLDMRDVPVSYTHLRAHETKTRISYCRNGI